MASFRWLDFGVICAYVLGLTVVGLRFSRRQTTTERYLTAKRSAPAWAVGLSFLTAMVTSVTSSASPARRTRRTGRNWCWISAGTISHGTTT